MTPQKLSTTERPLEDGDDQLGDASLDSISCSVQPTESNQPSTLSFSVSTNDVNCFVSVVCLEDRTVCLEW